MPVDSARRLFQGGIKPLVLKAKLRPVRILLACRLRGNVDPTLAGAVQDHAALPGRSCSNGTSMRHAGMLRQRREHQLKQLVVDARPQGDRPLSERQLRVVQQGRRIGAGLRSQPFARRAPAQRTVERETVRRQLLEAASAAIAGKMLAVISVRHCDSGTSSTGYATCRTPVPSDQGVLDAVGYARSPLGTDRDPIDDHFDRMLAAAIDRRRLVDRVRLPVDAHPQIAGRANLVP